MLKALFEILPNLLPILLLPPILAKCPNLLGPLTDAISEPLKLPMTEFLVARRSIEDGYSYFWSYSSKLTDWSVSSSSSMIVLVLALLQRVGRRRRANYYKDNVSGNLALLFCCGLNVFDL